MLFARIVLGLPVEGPFDYIVPLGLEDKAKLGSRVWVNFCNRKMLGYIVDIAHQSKIKKLKNLSEIIDVCPVLDKNMLLLCKEISEYYCCSWGEAIDAALPQGIRKGKIITQSINPGPRRVASKEQVILLQDSDCVKRWDIYLESIKNTLAEQKSAILIFADKKAAIAAKEIIYKELNLPSEVLYRNIPKELEVWQKIKLGEANIVVGTFSSVFAPVPNLGLIIIDEEGNSLYKQDQVPHYNVREAAFMRTKIENSKLVLASTSASLESFYLAKNNEIDYSLIPRQREYPQVKIIDMKSEYSLKNKNKILSRYLHDSIIAGLSKKEKILLFLDRKGFATVASCHNCGINLKCPRCNINLNFHFNHNILSCHYCNFKMEVPKICPSCNAGYIKFSGAGTEKVESELSRIFPQAKIKIMEQVTNADILDADMFVATSFVVQKKKSHFDLIGVLSIDNSLNRIDFRSEEKTFGLLSVLLSLTEKKLIIQTKLPGRHSFQALVTGDLNVFYEAELKNRKQLNFPPYSHMALVKLRGKSEEKTKEAAESLFEKLSKCTSSKTIKAISVNPAVPAKLRGNFYWQVLLNSSDPKKICRFLKINLKDFLHSGIIVTVDVDPL